MTTASGLNVLFLYSESHCFLHERRCQCYWNLQTGEGLLTVSSRNQSCVSTSAILLFPVFHIAHVKPCT
jgi:hypothetical protein